MTLHSVRSPSGYYTTFSLVRKVTYHRRSFTKAQEAVPPRTLKMLEHAKGDYFIITLGSETIEIAAEKKDAYRMLDAAENVLKALGWVLVEEVNA